MNFKHHIASVRPLLVAVSMLLACGMALAQGSDEVGVYFDDGYSLASMEVTSFPEVVTGYLVMHEPSAAAGVSGWELCAALDGPAQFSSWTLEGQTINTSTPPCFTVGIGGAPLPAAADILLATFQLIVTDLQPVYLSLKPKYNPSIPGSMSYLDGADLNHIIPLATTTGIPQVATINDTNPWYELSDTSYDFGFAYIAQTLRKTFSVTNVGGGFLALDIHLDPQDPAFSLDGPSGVMALGAGETAYIAVNFTPQSEGLASTHLVFGGIVPDVPLRGTGQEPPVNIWVSTQNLSFGSVPVNSAAAAQVTIKNQGLAPVTISPALADTTGPFTIIAGGGEVTIPPGDTTVVQVEFAPTEPGSFVTAMTYYPGEPSIAINGSAPSPTYTFTVDPDPLAISPVAAGYPVTGVLRVTNTGNQPLDLDVHLAPGAPKFSVTSGDGPIQLQPGQGHMVEVRFLSQSVGSFNATLVMGGIVPEVPVTAVAEEPVPGCSVSPLNLALGDVFVGQSATGFVTANNTGNIPLDLQPHFADCSYFSVDTTTVSVPPNGQHQFTVTFHPLSEGFWSCQLDLGAGSCSPTLVSGSASSFNGGADGMAGIYFDPGYLYDITGTTQDNEMVTAYLVLENPSNTSGVAGWECKLGLVGDAEFVDFNLQGQFINVETPPDFLVGIGGSPLPYSSHILLTEFRFLVTSPWSEVQVTLGPIYHATIPGFSAWIPWDNLEDPRSMQDQPGDVVLALVTQSWVGVEAPLPAAAMTADGVSVTWRLDDAGGEGCHLYRRIEGQEPVRLTGQPLMPRGAEFSYTDPATGIRPGTVLYYSYAVVRNGSEDTRSPEVEVTMGGIPVDNTRLLANVPNPFNPMTEVRFELAASGPVRLMVFDLSGRRVRTLADETMGAGFHTRLWQGRDDAGRTVPSGAYYVRLEANGRFDHRKVMLLK